MGRAPATLLCLLILVIRSGSVSLREDEPQCYRMVSALQEYITVVGPQYMPRSVWQQVQWMTSIDVMDTDQMRELVCSMAGSSSQDIADYLTDSGVTEHAVRRAYGAMMASVYEFWPFMSYMAKQAPPTSNRYQMAMLTEEMIRLLNNSGFMSLDDDAVQEARTMMLQKRTAIDVCGRLNDILDSMIAITDPFLLHVVHFYINMVTGIDISDTVTVKNLDCQLIQSTNIRDMIAVLNDYGILEHVVTYGLNELARLPYNASPISQFEETMDWTDEQLAAALYLPSPEAITGWREEARVAVAFANELNEYLSSIDYITFIN